MFLSNLDAVSKGTTAQVLLVKEDFLTIPSISGDSYFSVLQNWAHVQLIFKSVTGNNQKITLLFDLSSATPSCEVKTSDYVQDIFNLESLTIFDHDSGYITVPKEELPGIEIFLAVGGAFFTDLIIKYIGGASFLEVPQYIYSGNFK